MNEILAAILAQLLPVAACVVAAFASWALQRLAKRWKLDIDLRKDTAIRVATRQVIFGVEEWAAKKLKVEHKPVEGAEKGLKALAIMRSLFPDLLAEDLDRILHEELGMTPGMGASGFLPCHTDPRGSEAASED
jgi:hypothetical protein